MTKIAYKVPGFELAPGSRFTHNAKAAKGEYAFRAGSAWRINTTRWSATKASFLTMFGTHFLLAHGVRTGTICIIMFEDLSGVVLAVASG